MTFTVPPDLEQQVNDLVLHGDYPSPEAVLADAVKALVRERERQRIEALLAEGGMDTARLERLLQEAEDSGDYTDLTAADWEDIERDGLAAVNARKAR